MHPLLENGKQRSVLSNSEDREKGARQLKDSYLSDKSCGPLRLRYFLNWRLGSSDRLSWDLPVDGIWLTGPQVCIFITEEIKHNLCTLGEYKGWRALKEENVVGLECSMSFISSVITDSSVHLCQFKMFSVFSVI